jgi:ABC-type antimicrobial peptide transport system permease subunit
MKYRKVITLITFLLLGLVSVAQGTMPPPPMPPPPPGLPIDGGILILFLIAFSFGIYKAYKISRKAA